MITSHPDAYADQMKRRGYKNDKTFVWLPPDRERHNDVPVPCQSKRIGKNGDRPLVHPEPKFIPSPKKIVEATKAANAKRDADAKKQKQIAERKKRAIARHNGLGPMQELVLMQIKKCNKPLSALEIGGIVGKDRESVYKSLLKLRDKKLIVSVSEWGGVKWCLPAVLVRLSRQENSRKTNDKRTKKVTYRYLQALVGSDGATTADIARLAGSGINTARNRVYKLRAAGYLKIRGTKMAKGRCGRDRIYVLTDKGHEYVCNHST